MAIQFKDSETKVNLMKAFAGESQARNRYTFAADKAKSQGMYAISDVFLFTAEQERAHAERFYDLLAELSGQTIEICGGYPVDKQENVKELLIAAQHNEYEEANDVYQAFGKTAQEEGFMEAASAFLQIAKIEQIHGDRFARIEEMLTDGTYFETSENEKWMCTNCGHIHTGKKLPGVCPVCRYERGYFIPLELAPYKTEEFQ